MIVSRFGITNFRNISTADIEPNKRFNILAGNNGAGKSNILEALYVLGNVRSFRPAKNLNLVQHDSEFARISAELRRGEMVTDISLVIKERRKSYALNGKNIKAFADLMGKMVTVAFTPSDLSLLQGSTTNRRRFIDRLVCGVKPAHLDDLQRYEMTIRNRNRLLKEGRPNPDLMSAYTEQLIPLAAHISQRRRWAVETIAPLVSEVFANIFGAAFEVDCDYISRWLPDGTELPREVEEIASALEQMFSERQRAEQAAGHTLVGPHRDDLDVRLDGRPVREYASQGQLRSVVLALKLTEIRFLQESIGENPIILLDDVSSELDSRRNEQLFEFVNEMESQTFITTTDRRYIRIEDDVRVFRVEDGEILIA